MHEWYPCWVSGLRLDSTVESGWQIDHESNTIYHDSTRPDCWWTPPGKTCAEYFLETHDREGNAVPGQAALEDLPEAGWHDAHDTGSAAQWEHFYDQQTADLVYAMYRDDFIAFGYERHVVGDAR